MNTVDSLKKLYKTMAGKDWPYDPNPTDAEVIDKIAADASTGGGGGGDSGSGGGGQEFDLKGFCEEYGELSQKYINSTATDEEIAELTDAMNGNVPFAIYLDCEQTTNVITPNEEYGEYIFDVLSLLCLTGCCLVLRKIYTDDPSGCINYDGSYKIGIPIDYDSPKFYAYMYSDDTSEWVTMRLIKSGNTFVIGSV